MRPFAVLIGIVLGSSAALAIALSMTAVIFLVLADEFPARLALERRPLAAALAWSAAVAGLAAAAFVGELRVRRWRRTAQLALALLMAAAIWYYV